jgi:hypothetical protein
MSDTPLYLVSLGSIFIGLLSALLFSFFLKSKRAWVKALIKAPVYGLFLGLGVFGGSPADPGFALPVPIITAWIYAEPSERLEKSILPFIIWTLIFLLYEAVKYSYLSWRNRKKVISN